MEPAELYIHTQLRCYLAFLLFALVPYNSFATGACVEKDSVAIVLDPNITPSQYFPEGSHISSNSTGTWNFTTNGVKLYGSSACVENARFDANGNLYDNDILVQNEHNTGSKCYCRLIYPVVSKWVYLTTLQNTASNCGNTHSCQCTPFDCKYQCSWSIGQSSSVNWRKQLFSSITQ